MMAANLNQPGEITVSLAGALPITEAGSLLTLRFQLADSAQGTSLQLIQGEVNEGAVPVQLVDGQLGSSQLYLPLVLSSVEGLIVRNARTQQAGALVSSSSRRSLPRHLCHSTSSFRLNGYHPEASGWRNLTQTRAR